MMTRVLLAGLLAVTAVGATRAEERGVAARVNGVEISSERLERYLEEVGGARDFLSMSDPGVFKRKKREALEQLVEQELLWQEARRRDAVAPQEEVEAALAQLRARFASDAAYLGRLERAGFTASTYAEYVRRLLSIQRLVERDVAPTLSVTDEEVRAFLEARSGSRTPGAEAIPEIRKSLLAAKLKKAVAERVGALRAQARIEIGLAL
jgi:parvulin-like peptidyl-prolyl isomerase